MHLKHLTLKVRHLKGELMTREKEIKENLEDMRETKRVLGKMKVVAIITEMPLFVVILLVVAISDKYDNVHFHHHDHHFNDDDDEKKQAYDTGSNRMPVRRRSCLTCLHCVFSNVLLLR